MLGYPPPPPGPRQLLVTSRATHPPRRWPGTATKEGRGGGVGLGWVKASPGRLPTVRAAFPAGPDWAAVPGCPVTRPTGLLTAPRPRGGARGREMPPCLCVCALVCLRGGGEGCGTPACSIVVRRWRTWRGEVCAWCSRPRQGGWRA